MISPDPSSNVRVILLQLERAALTHEGPFRDAMAAMYASSFRGEPIEGAQVRIHRLSLDAAGYHDETISLLAESEARRANRFRSEKLRQTYICVHAVLRTLIAHELDLNEPLLEDYDKGVFGKPVLRGNKGLHFNISYREGLAALAIGPVPVGIDLELVRDGICIDEISERVFTSHERDYLNAAKPHVRRTRFFDLWTRKEALIKAAGLGIDSMPACEALEPQMDIKGPDGNSSKYGLQQLGTNAKFALSLALRLHPSMHNK